MVCKNSETSRNEFPQLLNDFLAFHNHANQIITKKKVKFEM